MVLFSSTTVPSFPRERELGKKAPDGLYSMWGLPGQLLVSEGARGGYPVPRAAQPCSAQCLDAVLTACECVRAVGRINKSQLWQRTGSVG